MMNRIESAKERISKLEARIARINEALSTGKNPYFYDESDKRRTESDIATAKETLKKEINRAAAEEQLNSEKIEVIERFLDEWEKKAVDYYTATALKVRGLIKEIGDLPYDERRSKRREIVEYYGQMVYRYATSCFGDIEKDVASDKKAKRKIFYERIKEITGRITDARGLHIGDNGEINGLAVGESGSARVETISAGGYNIQCFHYRVLVKKV